MMIQNLLMLRTFQILRDQLVEGHDFLNLDASAGQGQQILHNGSRSLTGLVDGHYGLAQGAVFRKIHEQQLGIADKTRKDIIEIMGNPTGQRADGFHFLCFSELGFEIAPFFFRLFALDDFQLHAVGVRGPGCDLLEHLATLLACKGGARDDQWTLEALDWHDGSSAFHTVIGGQRYNPFFSGTELDEAGRIHYGTPWGRVRLAPRSE